MNKLLTSLTALASLGIAFSAHAQAQDTQPVCEVDNRSATVEEITTNRITYLRVVLNQDDKTVYLSENQFNAAETRVVSNQYCNGGIRPTVAIQKYVDGQKYHLNCTNYETGVQVLANLEPNAYLEVIEGETSIKPAFDKKAANVVQQGIRICTGERSISSIHNLLRLGGPSAG